MARDGVDQVANNRHKALMQARRGLTRSVSSSVNPDVVSSPKGDNHK